MDQGRRHPVVANQILIAPGLHQPHAQMVQGVVRLHARIRLAQNVAEHPLNKSSQARINANDKAWSSSIRLVILVASGICFSLALLCGIHSHHSPLTRVCMVPLTLGHRGGQPVGDQPGNNPGNKVHRRLLQVAFLCRTVLPTSDPMAVARGRLFSCGHILDCVLCVSCGHASKPQVSNTDCSLLHSFQAKDAAMVNIEFRSSIG